MSFPFLFSKRKVLLLVLLSVYCSGCSCIVNHLAFFPDRKFTIPAARLPLNIEERFIITKDKKKLQCYYLRCDTSKTLLIYFHGNGGNISYRLPELMKLHRFNISVLGVWYRGYGKSAGSPSEKGIYRDGQAAMRYAIDTLGFKQSRIIICGRSIGTTVAIKTALDRTPGGLILITPLTTGREYACAHGLGAIAGIAGKSFNNSSRCGLIKCPVLVLHGTSDEVIPYRMGEEIFKKLTVSDKKFITIKQGYHNDLEMVDSTAYWNGIRDFINFRRSAEN